MAIPVTHDLSLYRGDDHQFTVTCYDEGATPQPVDLTNHALKAQIRTSEDGEVMAEFDCELTEINVITLTLPSSASSQVSSNGVWDVQSASPEATPKVTTWARGAVTVTKDVTR